MATDVASAKMVRDLRRDFELFKKQVLTANITPSGAGNIKPAGQDGKLTFDLSGFLTVEDARKAGVNI